MHTLYNSNVPPITLKHFVHVTLTTHIHLAHTAPTTHIHLAHTAPTTHIHLAHTAPTTHIHLAHTAPTTHIHLAHTAPTTHIHLAHTAPTTHIHLAHTAPTTHSVCQQYDIDQEGDQQFEVVQAVVVPCDESLPASRREGNLWDVGFSTASCQGLLITLRGGAQRAVGGRRAHARPVVA